MSAEKHTKLGQHFLTRPEIAGWVAEAATLATDSVVLEIGPGHGILTNELLKRAGKVVAVEKDPALVAELQATFAEEIASGKFVLLCEDVRDFDPSHVDELRERYTVAANIPYYITGYIIRKFLTTEHQPQNMALLVQKEVAERIVARDGKGSLLSNSVKVYGTPAYVRTVKAGAFSPPPKVDSAILSISDISRSQFTDLAEETLFFEVLRAGFSSKRKMLAGNLKGEVTSAAFSSCNIAREVRAEDLSPLEWLCLCKN